MRSRLATTLLTAYAPASWGTTYFVTTEWLPAHKPLLAGVVRALPSGLLLLAWSRLRPHGEWWWKATLLGVVNVGLLFAGLFVSAERLPGGIAATISAVGPLEVALLAWPVLGLRPGVRVVIAGLVGVVGVALLVSTPNTSLDALGVLAALGSTTSFAVGTVLIKRWGRPVPLVAFTGWQLTAGGLFLVPFWLLAEGAPHTLGGTAIGGFVYLALANTAIAYSVYFLGLEHLSATAVAFLLLLTPIVATVIGYAVLDQSLSGLQISGMFLAGVGLVAGQGVSAPRLRESRRVLLRR